MPEMTQNEKDFLELKDLNDAVAALEKFEPWQRVAIMDKTSLHLDDHWLQEMTNRCLRIERYRAARISRKLKALEAEE